MIENKTVYIQRKMRQGWQLLAGGILLFAIGIGLQLWVAGLPFNARIVSGLGILLIGFAASILVRYNAAKKDPGAARQILVENTDERLQLIRARAGSRAYLVSAAMAWLGLMWVSFSASGSLPVLSQDSLWYFLAVLVIAPFAVYAGSMYLDQNKY